MWVMLTDHVSVEEPPPVFMGIYWATPWPIDVETNRKQHLKDMENSSLYRVARHGAHECLESVYGCEPEYSGAMRVRVAGRDVRVYPHEFSEVLASRMHLYVMGTDNAPPSHELVEDEVAGDDTLKEVRQGARRKIYDAALVDGCTHAQALAVSMGIDVTDAEIEFPAVGWYRPTWETLEYFCTEDQLKRIEVHYGRW